MPIHTVNYLEVIERYGGRCFKIFIDAGFLSS